MKVTLRGATELRRCPDCKSEHLGAACGGNFVARLRSVRLDPSATPTRDLKRYWDDESVSSVFNDGLTGKERKEKMFDETDGVGFVDRHEFDTPKGHAAAQRIFGDDE